MRAYVKVKRKNGRTRGRKKFHQTFKNVIVYFFLLPFHINSGVPMSKTHSNNLKVLEQKITSGRKKMQEAYTARDCTDSVVLAYSIKLDKLIVQYQTSMNRINNHN